MAGSGSKLRSHAEPKASSRKGKLLCCMCWEAFSSISISYCLPGVGICSSDCRLCPEDRGNFLVPGARCKQSAPKLSSTCAAVSIIEKVTLQFVAELRTGSARPCLLRSSASVALHMQLPGRTKRKSGRNLSALRTARVFEDRGCSQATPCSVCTTQQPSQCQVAARPPPPVAPARAHIPTVPTHARLLGTKSVARRRQAPAPALTARIS